MSKTITLPEYTPLLGLLHIGIIDRGSTLLQVRSTTVCNMHCSFCSTAANEEKVHPYNFNVKKDHLLKWVEEAITLKNNQVTEINIDSVGEPTTDQNVPEIITHCKQLETIKRVSMQTNGTLLTKQLINKLNEAQLDRINISIHSLDQEQGKELFGNQGYNINKILESLEYLKETNIKVNITPVWLPKINDQEIPKLIQLSKNNNTTIAIQKYEVYKNSRQEKKAKELNWWKFYKQLGEWEKEYNNKLKVGPHDFDIKRTQKIPRIFTKGDKVMTEVIAPGWYPNQATAMAKNRSLTILNTDAKENERKTVKITEDTNGIYIATT